MGIKKFPKEGGVHVPPSTPPPPSPPPEKSVYLLALPSMNGPLPAELKFGENPVLRTKVLHAIEVPVK